MPLSMDCFPYHDKFRKKVFFALTWQRIYHKGEQQLQEFDYSVELEKALIDTYEEKGFEMLLLPKSVPRKEVFS